MLRPVVTVLVAEAMEDSYDLADARESLKEPGEIDYAEMKRRLGL